MMDANNVTAEVLRPKKGKEGHDGGLLFSWDTGQASILLKEGKWIVKSNGMTTKEVVQLVYYWVLGMEFDHVRAD